MKKVSWLQESNIYTRRKKDLLSRRRNFLYPIFLYMEKNDRLLWTERSDAEINDMIAQLVKMSKHDIQIVLDHRKLELRQHAPVLYALLCDIVTLQELKIDREREEQFLQIEQEILNTIPEHIRDSVVTRRKLLLEKDKERYEKEYREFIILLANKEIIITPQETIFPAAHLAILHQEMKFPTSKIYSKVKYNGGKTIRHEIHTTLFDADHAEHKNLMRAIASLSKKGYSILTKEDISKIIHSRSWWNYDRISTFLYSLTGPGKFILEPKPHTRYYDTGPYECESQDLHFLSLYEEGRYYEYSRAAYGYREDGDSGSFLLTRPV